MTNGQTFAEGDDVELVRDAAGYKKGTPGKVAVSGLIEGLASVWFGATLMAIEPDLLKKV